MKKKERSATLRVSGQLENSKMCEQAPWPDKLMELMVAGVGNDRRVTQRVGKGKLLLSPLL